MIQREAPGFTIQVRVRVRVRVALWLQHSRSICCCSRIRFCSARSGRQTRPAPPSVAQVIGPGMMATMEWRCTRIRIWLDKQQRVSQPPMIG